MSIHKKAKKNDALNAFVNGAPDALDSKESTESIYDKGVKKGRKRQISITLTPEILQATDERAQAMGLGRSAFVAMALYKILKEG